MPGCVRNLNLFKLSLLLMVLVLCSCKQAEQDFGFEVENVDARWRNGRMMVDFQHEISLSDEAREALVHGVPLTVALELILRNTNNQAHVVERTERYEINYLPLSDHYRLSLPGDGGASTFPRLRHVLAELSALDLSFETGPLPRGDYELLVRLHLDTQSMPPPMRLPVWLSSRWRHDSDWSAWPLEIDPQA